MTPIPDLDVPASFLGHVDLPTGILLILDPGIGRYWHHREEPFYKRDQPQTDFRIEGRDALAAASAFDRQFDPGYIFDIPGHAAEEMQECFATFCAENGFEAALVPLAERMPHLERAHSAVVAGGGLGIVQYNGVWAVVVAGFESGARLEVQAVPMPEGEFKGRWQRIEIVSPGCADQAVEVDEIDGVMVDHEQFIFSDLEAFGAFRMWESLDGLGDFVFWGKDAAALAAETGAVDLGGGEFGWKDLPMDELRKLASETSGKIRSGKLQVGEDFRPHCNLELMNAQVRNGEMRTGAVSLDGSAALGMDNRWGDGIFAVQRHRDSAGKTVKVVMELGTEQRQSLMREMWMRYRFAMVSLKVLRDGEPVGFGERMATDREQDSGWVFWSGSETQEELDDSRNFTLVHLGDLIAKDNALKVCLRMPEECFIRREGDEFVVEE